jgi:hypothetical protein
MVGKWTYTTGMLEETSPLIYSLHININSDKTAASTPFGSTHYEYDTGMSKHTPPIITGYGPSNDAATALYTVEDVKFQRKGATRSKQRRFVCADT